VSMYETNPTAHDKVEALAAAPAQVNAQVKAKAQGNPLAAGLIAFGAGLLVSSLVAPSQKERQAAQQLKSAAEPLATQLTGAAKDMVQDLKEPAQDALDYVKAAAADGVQNVKAEGQGAATDVKDRATGAKERLS